MIFGKDFDEMFSYTSRMLMCMDMAMPMPTLLMLICLPDTHRNEIAAAD